MLIAITRILCKRSAVVQAAFDGGQQNCHCYHNESILYRLFQMEQCSSALENEVRVYRRYFRWSAKCGWESPESNFYQAVWWLVRTNLEQPIKIVSDFFPVMQFLLVLVYVTKTFVPALSDFIHCIMYSISMGSSQKSLHCTTTLSFLQLSVSFFWRRRNVSLSKFHNRQSYVYFENAPIINKVWLETTTRSNYLCPNNLLLSRKCVHNLEAESTNNV